MEEYDSITGKINRRKECATKDACQYKLLNGVCNWSGHCSDHLPPDPDLIELEKKLKEEITKVFKNYGSKRRRPI